MEKYKKTKTTLEGLRSDIASDHTMRVDGFKWCQSSTNNNHIYFNDEWNDEYES